MRIGFKVEDIHKIYRNKVYALKDINLVIEKPGLYGIIGPNGAGKTTLFKIIAGIVCPTRGKVTFFNEEKLTKSKKKIIGFLPEDAGIYEKLTAKQFLHVMAGFQGLNKEERKEAVLSVVKLTGIDFDPGMMIKNLSNGQRKLLLLASILLHDPPILILDESLAGLDPIHREHIAKIMKKVSQKKIVLFSSHILSDIWRLCDRVITINKGRIIMEDSPENITRNVTHNAYFIEVQETEKEELLPVLKRKDNVEIKDVQLNKIIFTVDKKESLKEIISYLTNKHYVTSFGPYVPDLDQLFIKIVGEKK